MKTTLKIGLLLMVVACTDRSKHNTSEDPLKTEVIAIHDEAMDNMGLIMSLKRRLKEAQDSTNRQIIANTMVALDQAHEEMMSWMRNFSKLFPHATLKGGHQQHSEAQGDTQMKMMSEEEEHNVLVEEKKKVILLRDQMNRSIEEARILLDDKP